MKNQLFLIIIIHIAIAAMTKLFSLECSSSSIEFFYPYQNIQSQTSVQGFFTALLDDYQLLYESLVTDSDCQDMTYDEFNSRFSIMADYMNLLFGKEPDVEYDCDLKYKEEIGVMYDYAKDIFNFDELHIDRSCSFNSKSCDFTIDFGGKILQIFIQQCESNINSNFPIPSIEIFCVNCQNLYQPCTTVDDCDENHICTNEFDITELYDDYFHDLQEGYKKYVDGLGNEYISLSNPNLKPIKLMSNMIEYIYDLFWNNFNTIGNICLPIIDATKNCSSSSNVEEEWFCGNFLYVDENACNGIHGYCAYGGMCICSSEYMGEFCETLIQPICYDFDKDDPNVCHGHGQCVSDDHCSCEPEYVGNMCEEIMDCSDLNDCSIGGTCIGYNNCKCNKGYGGLDCSEMYTCFGEVLESACHNNGECVGIDECLCNEYFKGDDCIQPFICGGVKAYQLNVCNGNGNCVNDNVCECFPGFDGKNCENDLSCKIKPICKGNSMCKDDGTGMWKCLCKDGYEGEYCILAMCFDKVGEEACGGSRGTCIKNDECKCDFPFIGDECEEIMTCNTIPVTDYDNVCSGFGICQSKDQCLCDDEHTGIWCSEKVQCFNKYYDDPTVCGGKQICTKTGCIPDPDYVPVVQVDICYYDIFHLLDSVPICFGISPNNNTICSGHGDCVDDTCMCDLNWINSDCSKNINDTTGTLCSNEYVDCVHECNDECKRVYELCKKGDEKGKEKNKCEMGTCKQTCHHGCHNEKRKCEEKKVVDDDNDDINNGNQGLWGNIFGTLSVGGKVSLVVAVVVAISVVMAIVLSCICVYLYRKRKNKIRHSIPIPLEEENDGKVEPFKTPMV